MKTKNEICECGHDLALHSFKDFKIKCMVKTIDLAGIGSYCTCKKFTLQNEICANCGYKKRWHPIAIWGQEKEIFLDWKCKKFTPKIDIINEIVDAIKNFPEDYEIKHQSQAIKRIETAQNSKVSDNTPQITSEKYNKEPTRIHAENTPQTKVKLHPFVKEDLRRIVNDKDNYIDYCCKYMKELDEENIIDYCPPNLTTLDVNGSAYPICFCPFCGKEIIGSRNAVKEIKLRLDEIHEKAFGINTPQTNPLKDYDWEKIREEVSDLMKVNDELTKDKAKMIIASNYGINYMSFDNWFYKKTNKKTKDKHAEISLSDKGVIITLVEGQSKHVYYHENVKEAVMRLKSHLCRLNKNNPCNDCFPCKEINEIFGKELAE